MCGFVAFFEKDRVFANELLNAAERDLWHRGPDSGGRVRESDCAMVFRRLAILDINMASDQPMTDTSGRYTLVFNGEIYNYMALREALIEEGVRFRTTGDTEVILAGYLYWGEKILDRLEGMYAFVIWDRVEKSVLAARDPLGIKPLYVARRGDFVGFASEMRPLRRIVGSELDIEALADLVMFRFAGGRLSNLKNIEMLPGGTVVRFSVATGSYRERRFCDFLETFAPQEEMTEKEALRVIEDSLDSSVECHLQSDVGYALQLSGGVDSSIIAALVREKNLGRLRSFGVNLGNLPQDESEYRDIVIGKFGLQHKEVFCSNQDFADALPRAISHMEGPSPHFGCVMLMLLCEKIRETDKVVLTGEGADELFGGYMRYALWRDLRFKGRVARLVPNFLWPFLQRYRAVQRYAEHDPAIVSSVYFDFLKMHEIFPALAPVAGIREEVAGRFRGFRQRLMAVDQVVYLSSLLLRQDKMAMAASVEARVPYVHLPVFKALNHIPDHLRIPGKKTKPLLKTYGERWFTAEFLNRRKVGLALPLDQWLRDEKGLGRYLEYLTAPDCRMKIFARQQALKDLVEKNRTGRVGGGMSPLPHLVNMELWLRSLDEPLSKVEDDEVVISAVH